MLETINNPINLMLLMCLLGIIAGTLGSILGIGGGMIVTPAVTLLFGIDIKYAIGASIISVIATSSGSTIAYIKDELVNLRVAMFLEIFTTVGAILGAVMVGIINPVWLYFLFGALLLFSAFNMIKKLLGKTSDQLSTKNDPLAEKLKLNASYYDHTLNKKVDYKVENVPAGSAVMFGAGFASGLLGIGSGVFKVMALDTFMKMPMKPSTATSNLMMGVTAAASALVFFFKGQIQPSLAAPIALGVLVGAMIGTRIMPRLPNKILRGIFIPLLVFVGIQMIVNGFKVI